MDSIPDVNAGPIVFFPYGTPACTLQHHALAKTLEISGVRTEIGVKFSQKSDLVKPISEETTNDRLQFGSIVELLDYLEDVAGGNPMISRGLIDEFIRKGPLSSLCGDPHIPKSFLEIAVERISYARRAVSGKRGVFLADSGYLFNRSVLDEAENRGIPVWVSNPDGTWLQADSKSDEVFNPNEFVFAQNLMAESASLPEQAERYTDRRFLGRSRNDLDSSAAFAGTHDLPAWLEGRRVLFLHAFRDASNIPLSEQGNRKALFRTYIEWADFVFSKIRTSQDQWAIRQHPSADFYEGDRAILDFLRAKNGITDIPMLEGVSTHAILSNRVPLFTHSGTVALEAAAMGYKAHICSTKFPSSLSHQLLTEDALEQALTTPYENLITSPVSAHDQLTAKTMLFLRHDAKEWSFAPRVGQATRVSPKSFQLGLLKQQLSLLRKTVRPRVAKDLASKVSDVISSLPQTSDRK